MNGKMWIDIKTKRDVRLFLWMAGNDVAIENYRQTKEMKTYHLNHIYGEDCNLAALAINEAFRILYNDSDELFSYAYRFKKAKEALLPIKEFGWFKRSNDACYFAWAYIRVFSKKNSSLANVGGNDSFSIYTRTPYRRFIRIEHPVSHRERIECIEDFFDRSPMDLSSKLSIMLSIRDAWDRHSQLADILPLKKSDKGKINWAWDYISKDKINYINGSIKRAQEKLIEKSKTDETGQVSQAVLDEIYKSSIEGYIHQPHFLSLFRPSTTTEKYLALRCIYISMYYYDKKFIPRFKKAWELTSFRKAKKKNKNKILKLTKRELDGNDTPSDSPDNTEKEIAKTDKELMREKAHEIMKNIKTRNSELSSEKGSGTPPDLSRNGWPFF
ncbi:TPA: hypothetical protein ACGR7J_000819 [Escherichia coli]|nr:MULTISPECIES: hypothetical protein [Enterobacteriaceae]MCL9531795.1 hypothetical protein [Salmonella enterica subsp. enterica serovar Enteritidis]MCN9861059.1 hypothetical protein [Escherichia coli]MDJ4001689.1 hypothetical protein [Salmonella enterica]MDJ4286934.1 hypothetical protein [Salmonella enterica]MDJ4633177.1 hypothetical protein [Salmonella enterica]